MLTEFQSYLRLFHRTYCNYIVSLCMFVFLPTTVLFLTSLLVGGSWGTILFEFIQNFFMFLPFVSSTDHCNLKMEVNIHHTEVQTLTFLPHNREASYCIYSEVSAVCKRGTFQL